MIRGRQVKFDGIDCTSNKNATPPSSSSSCFGFRGKTGRVAPYMEQQAQRPSLQAWVQPPPAQQTPPWVQPPPVPRVVAPSAKAPIVSASTSKATLQIPPPLQQLDVKEDKRVYSLYEDIKNSIDSITLEIKEKYKNDVQAYIKSKGSAKLEEVNRKIEDIRLEMYNRVPFYFGLIKGADGIIKLWDEKINKASNTPSKSNAPTPISLDVSIEGAMIYDSCFRLYFIKRNLFLSSYYSYIKRLLRHFDIIASSGYSTDSIERLIESDKLKLNELRDRTLIYNNLITRVNIIDIVKRQDTIYFQIFFELKKISQKFKEKYGEGDINIKIFEDSINALKGVQETRINTLRKCETFKDIVNILLQNLDQNNKANELNFILHIMILLENLYNPIDKSYQSIKKIIDELHTYTRYEYLNIENAIKEAFNEKELLLEAGVTGGRRKSHNHKKKPVKKATMNMKDVKGLCKANQIKLSKTKDGVRVIYTKKELITKLKRKKIL